MGRVHGAHLADGSDRGVLHRTMDEAECLSGIFGSVNVADELWEALESYEDARTDFNKARELLGLKTFRRKRADKEA